LDKFKVELRVVEAIEKILCGRLLAFTLKGRCEYAKGSHFKVAKPMSCAMAGLMLWISDTNSGTVLLVVCPESTHLLRLRRGFVRPERALRGWNDA
jgi:hypothetical protein